MPESRGLTRRGVLQGAAAGLAAFSTGARGAETGGAHAFLDLVRPPDAVAIQAASNAEVALTATGSRWRGQGVEVETSRAADGLAVSISAPEKPLERVHLRWRAAVEPGLLVLGDAWERSYGELGWRGVTPERPMPWYFATYAAGLCHAYGVRTGAGALCFWQLDAEGVSLWLDVRNGGGGVLLGQRTLAAATVVSRRGRAEDGGPGHALREFCKQMCSVPSRTPGPIYGFNDWYYAYGHNTAAGILDDTAILATLSEGNAVRPFSVVDDGWRHTIDFPDMAALAAQIKAKQVRPGIWIRPLIAPEDAPAALLLPDARFGSRQERVTERAYDPTIPEARARVLAKARQVVGWGYELIKQDFLTYDMLGQWGFEMGASPTLPGWSLHDRSRTNAEVISDLYRSLREACGTEALILGCNAVGHLGQGIFDGQRTGDDTSGKLWERTRRTGVNTLAYRLPQDRAFFAVDADCVGITADVPWEKNRQWLDVLARSGTAVFVSPGRGSRGEEQRAAMRVAFQLAAAGGSGAEPAGLPDESTPTRWVERGKPRVYAWSGPDGAWPFSI